MIPDFSQIRRIQIKEVKMEVFPQNFCDCRIRDGTVDSSRYQYSNASGMAAERLPVPDLGSSGNKTFGQLVKLLTFSYEE